MEDINYALHSHIWVTLSPGKACLVGNLAGLHTYLDSVVQVVGADVEDGALGIRHLDLRVGQVCRAMKGDASAQVQNDAPNHGILPPCTHTDLESAQSSPLLHKVANMWSAGCSAPGD